MPVLVRGTVTTTLEQLGVFQSTERPELQLSVTEDTVSIGMLLRDLHLPLSFNSLFDLHFRQKHL